MSELSSNLTRRVLPRLPVGGLSSSEREGDECLRLAGGAFLIPMSNACAWMSTFCSCEVAREMSEGTFKRPPSSCSSI